MCIHAAELLNVAARNVFGDDAADQLDHAVSYTSYAVDGNDAVGIVVAVVGEVIGLSLGLDTATS